LVEVVGAATERRQQHHLGGFAGTAHRTPRV
jgi:hypothetical protein